LLPPFSKCVLSLKFNLGGDNGGLQFIEAIVLQNVSNISLLIDELIPYSFEDIDELMDNNSVSGSNRSKIFGMKLEFSPLLNNTNNDDVWLSRFDFSVT